MRTRSNQAEILDRDDVRVEDLEVSFRFMRGVNRFLGGNAAIHNFFSHPSVPSHFSVLDLGFGGGDIPYSLSRWAEGRGKTAVITGVDLNPYCVKYAQRHYKAPQLQYLQSSAFDLESLGSFDYITASMFFHHLKDEDIVRLLKKIASHARKGFILNDLYRSWPAYFGAWTLALPSFKKIIWSDAPISVARAFRERDFEKYAHEAGLKNIKIERRPIWRLTLSSHA